MIIIHVILSTIHMYAIIQSISTKIEREYFHCIYQIIRSYIYTQHTVIIDVQYVLDESRLFSRQILKVSNHYTKRLYQLHNIGILYIHIYCSITSSSSTTTTTTTKVNFQNTQICTSFPQYHILPYINQFKLSTRYFARRSLPIQKFPNYDSNKFHANKMQIATFFQIYSITSFLFIVRICIFCVFLVGDKNITQLHFQYKYSMQNMNQIVDIS